MFSGFIMRNGETGQKDGSDCTSHVILFNEGTGAYSCFLRIENGKKSIAHFFPWQN